jgi:hypothetical protein
MYTFFFLGNDLDKEKDSSRDVKKVGKSEKKKESASSGQSEDANKKEKDGNEVKGIMAEEKVDGNDKGLEQKGGTEISEQNKTAEKKEQGESAAAETGVSVTSGKKKIIKKVVKQKVVDKADGDSASKQKDKLDEKDNGEKNADSEIPGQLDASSAALSGVKTFVRKRVIKKVPVRKTAQNEDTEDKPKDNSDPSSAAVVQGTSVKTTVKKKIIKRVAKRKVASLKSSDGVADTKIEVDADGAKAVLAVDETENAERQARDAENQDSEVKKSEKKPVPKTNSKTPAPEKQNDVVDSSNVEIKTDKDDKKDEKRTGEKSGSGSKVEIEADKQKASQNDNHSGKRGKSKDGEKSKDEKEKKDNDGKDESRSKSNKELKEKRKSEEPPRHPGLILQTKWSKASKVCLYIIEYYMLIRCVLRVHLI